jgi:predicted aminopeptidase
VSVSTHTPLDWMMDAPECGEASSFGSLALVPMHYAVMQVWTGPGLSLALLTVCIVTCVLVAAR